MTGGHPQLLNALKELKADCADAETTTFAERCARLLLQHAGCREVQFTVRRESAQTVLARFSTATPDRLGSEPGPADSSRALHSIGQAPVADGSQLVVEADPADSDAGLLPDVAQVGDSIAEIMAARIGHDVVRIQNQRLRSVQLISQAATAAALAPNLDESARIIAEACASAFAPIRITVHQLSESPIPTDTQSRTGLRRFRSKLLAASGTASVAAAARTVQLLEETAAVLAEKTQHLCHSAVLDVATAANSSEAAEENAILSPEAVTAFREAGIRAVMLIPLTAPHETPPEQAQADELTWVLLAEQYEADAPPDQASRKLIRSLLAEVADRKARAAGRRKLQSRRRRLAAFLFAVMCCCCLFLPVRFEIEADGRLIAADATRLYAPEDGIIDAVGTEDAGTVSPGTVLFELSGPELNEEILRTDGRIDSIVAEQAGVEAARIRQPGSASGSGNIGADLSERAELLAIQLDGLRRYRTLLQQRDEALRITAGTSGRLYLIRPEEELLSRPVNRGQQLGTLVPSDTQWQIRILVAADEAGYVPSAETGSVPARCRFPAAAGKELVGKLHRLDDYVSFSDSRQVVSGVVQLAAQPEFPVFPGMTVRTRIDCGRRSLGFVLFRGIVELWQQFRFAWL